MGKLPLQARRKKGLLYRRGRSTSDEKGLQEW